MTLNDAIVRDALGGRLPLKWRRRTHKWQARARARIRKIDKLVKGSHRRWSECRFREFLDEVFRAAPSTITLEGAFVSAAEPTAPTAGVYTLVRQ